MTVCILVETHLTRGLVCVRGVCVCMCVWNYCSAEDILGDSV